MINVVFGNNAVVVTLKDRVDLDPVFLILQLGSTTQTDFIKILQVTDQAAAACSTNEIVFDLVTKANEDLINGKVYLIEGNYNYSIYQSDAPGVDISGKKLLEKGLLRYDVDTVDDKKLDVQITEKTLID